MASTNDKDGEVAALKRELALVKNQRGALQAALIRYEQCGSNDVAVPVLEEIQQPFRFLDLSRELRDAVYQLCVVAGRIMIHSPSSISSGTSPIGLNAFDMRIAPSGPVETQLFRVCKEIKAEAVECYLTKNFFVLLAGPCISLLRNQRWHQITRVPHAGVAYGFLRRLSISLDYRDFNGLLGNLLVQRDHVLKPETPEKTEKRHWAMQKSLVDLHWFALFECMDKYLHLECLEINLQNCYCSLGCHRLVEKSFESLGPSTRGGVNSVFQLVKNLDLKRLNILGTIDKAERDFLRAGLSSMTSMKVRFYGERSWEYKWAKWDAEKEIVDDEDESKPEVGNS